MALPVDPGADFLVILDDLRPVTVTSVNPDTGATLASAANVMALKGETEKKTMGADGGTLPTTGDRWEFPAATVGFEVKEQDRITEAGGTAWLVEVVRKDVTGTMYLCDVEKAKG